MVRNICFIPCPCSVTHTFSCGWFQFESRLSECSPPDELFDIKLYLSPEQFSQITGPELLSRLLSAFSTTIPLQQQPDAEDQPHHWHEIILRRVQTSLLPPAATDNLTDSALPGRWVSFHRDQKTRTMQVFLNEESQYEGGHLVYLINSSDNNHVLCRVGRPVGGAVLHDSSVVHGVTRCSSGVRYSLFLIEN